MLRPSLSPRPPARPLFPYTTLFRSRELTGALRLVYSGSDTWVPPVLTCSGITGAGIDAVWEQITGHRDYLGPTGLDQKRADQRVDFMWSLVRDELEQRLATNEAVAQVKRSVREAVLSGTMPAANAADQILEAYDKAPRQPGKHCAAGYSAQEARATRGRR